MNQISSTGAVRPKNIIGSMTSLPTPSNEPFPSYASAARIPLEPAERHTERQNASFVSPAQAGRLLAYAELVSSARDCPYRRALLDSVIHSGGIFRSDALGKTELKINA